MRKLRIWGALGVAFPCLLSACQGADGSDAPAQNANMINATTSDSATFASSAALPDVSATNPPPRR